MASKLWLKLCEPCGDFSLGHWAYAGDTSLNLCHF